MDATSCFDRLDSPLALAAEYACANSIVEANCSDKPDTRLPNRFRFRSFLPPCQNIRKSGAQLHRIAGDDKLFPFACFSKLTAKKETHPSERSNKLAVIK
jgi:hypothetical protein